VEHFLGQTSTGGGSFQKSVSSGASVSLHTDLECTSCMIWTPDSDVYVSIGGAASASSFKLIPNAYIPVPVENLNKISAYVASGTITIYVIYRTK